ncbi:uncharacterized protein LOC132198144 [Neocloeon triangulifer]|uniref:uncharacterized protein LOC132198144 n=1 Tax=Neocloeon triangulifer TaxID=2078957 RepID=UPI00286ED45A|nr:uncharacterized protein LOC132198144 [Neocloeon triangulifer]XP_059477949.1 uncharacterized protein LOC132198144 [Neocloeon triangulifer]XP_059477950.1 uncharacterized protein LOC132198144 [Neocloeon triangulifer]
MTGLEKFQIFFELVPPIFYGGQTLNAKVVVVNSKPIQMKAFYIRVKGRCKMRSQSWRLESSEVDSLIPNFRNAPSNNDRRNLKGYNDSEDYINDQFAIFGWGNDGTLEPGEYSFPFTYTLPMNLPSSFETKFGCIRYTLMAEMHQPWTVVNHKARAFFAIICPLDLNSFPQLTDPVTKEIAKKLCCLCCASGPINIILSLPVGGAVPGETILPTLEVENNSGVDLIFISLRLTQVPCFRPSSVTKHLEYKTYIVEHPLGRLESGQYCTYERVALRIPPVPPSYLLHCKLFDLDYFVEIIYESAKKYIPRGRMKYYLPFWNPRLEAIRLKRNSARKAVEKTNTSQLREELKQLQTDLTAAITEEKDKKYREFLSNLDYRKDASKVHTFFSQLCGKKSSSAEDNTPLEYKGKSAVTNKEKAEILCRYFKSVSTPLRKKKKKLPKIKYQHQPNDFYNRPFNSEELNYAINKLDNKKAPGPDGIHVEFIKHLGPIARGHVLNLVNASWNCQVPTSWKEALITPILKPEKDPNNPKSYRPIALTNTFAKVAEKMVNLRLENFLESSKIIADEQAGYREHRGTLDQVAYVAQDIKQGFSEGKSTLAASIDLSGAFDSTDRRFAIKQMLNYKVPNNIVRWLHDFINGRSIKVIHKGHRSRTRKTAAGVAQGTITAPTTFKIAINELIFVLKTIQGLKIKVYADDFILLLTSKCPANMELKMSLALRIANSWLNVRGFKINETKTFCTYYTMTLCKYYFNIKVNDKKIQQTDQMKYLGVQMDSKMTGRQHFEEQAEKGRKRLRLLQRTAGSSWGAKIDTLALTYKTYVRPVLEYGTEIFPAASQPISSLLDKVQNQALRLITGGVKTTPIDAMEWFSQIEPLRLRREQRAIQLHEKLLRLDSEFWQNHNNSKKPAHANFVEITTKLKEKHCPDLLHAQRQNFETPSPFNMPDVSNQLEPALQIEGVEKKSNLQVTELQKKTDAHLKSNFPLSEWIHIYTDGSQDNSTQRAGYGVYCIFFEESTPLPEGANHFDAETAAIARAAQKVAEQDRFPLNKKKFVILSDSTSAIQFVCQPANLHPDSLLFKNSLVRLRKKNHELALQWIPSHCQILGNDKADFLAKAATKKISQLTKALTFNNVKKIIKTATKKIFKESKEEAARLKIWWTEIKKGPDKSWSRKTATAQFRLATGHDVLQHHLNRFKITKDSATCKLCKLENQDRAHLFRCAALKSDIDSLPKDLSRTEKEAILYWIARKRNS